MTCLESTSPVWYSFQKHVPNVDPISRKNQTQIWSPSPEYLASTTQEKCKKSQKLSQTRED